MFTNYITETKPNNNRKTLKAIDDRLGMDRLEKATFFTTRGLRYLALKGFEIKPDWTVLKVKNGNFKYEVCGNLNEYRIALHGDFGDGMMLRVANAVSQFATITSQRDTLLTFKVG